MQQFRNWYWIVNKSTTQVYCSLRNIYVPVSDPDYQAWLAVHGAPPNIESEADIWYYVGGLLPAWLFDGTTFAQPTASTLSKPQLKAYAALVRFDKETGGATVGGIAYPTDRETQSKMTAAVVLSQVNPSATFKWKIADGSFVDLNAAGILAVGSAVGAFVQACFATESAVVAAIDAGTMTTQSQVDSAFAA